MPIELVEARMIDGLCRRYHCLPSALLREDVGLLRIAALTLDKVDG